MKKIIILISLIFISMTIKPINSSAYDDCKIICPDIPWQTSGSTGFTVSGCNFVAYWSYRYADCGDYPLCDFKLDAIGCPGCPPSCFTNLPLYTITHAAMEAVIQSEGFNTLCAQNLPNDSCLATTTVNYSSCWKYSNPGPGGPSGLEPCDETQCCKEVWRICKDDEGEFIRPAVMVGQYGLNPVCESGECIAICEEQTPPVMPSGLEENINLETGFKTSVYPNPSDNIVNIRLISGSEGEHTIDIFDALGNIVISKNFDKFHNEMILQINMSNYSNGNYRYAIKQNGKNGISGSFNVVK